MLHSGLFCAKCYTEYESLYCVPTAKGFSRPPGQETFQDLLTLKWPQKGRLTHQTAPSERSIHIRHLRWCWNCQQRQKLQQWQDGVWKGHYFCPECRATCQTFSDRFSRNATAHWLGPKRGHIRSRREKRGESCKLTAELWGTWTEFFPSVYSSLFSTLCTSRLHTYSKPAAQQLSSIWNLHVNTWHLPGGLRTSQQVTMKDKTPAHDLNQRVKPNYCAMPESMKAQLEVRIKAGALFFKLGLISCSG